MPHSSKGKGKAGSKAADKGKNGESNVVYDYHEGSVHDIALRAQVMQGYEEFKVRVSCHVMLGGVIYDRLLLKSRLGYSLPMGRSRLYLVRWDGKR